MTDNYIGTSFIFGVIIGIIVGAILTLILVAQQYTKDIDILLPEKLCVGGLIQELDNTRTFYLPTSVKCIAIDEVKK